MGCRCRWICLWTAGFHGGAVLGNCRHNLNEILRASANSEGPRRIWGGSLILRDDWAVGHKKRLPNCYCRWKLLD